MLMTEGNAAVSYWRDEKWCGSTFLEEVDFPNDNEQYPYANKIKFRSWSGSLDKDIECVPKG